MKCLISAYRISFEQAEEYTRLTDEEDDEEDREINHYKVDCLLHLDEKVYVLVFICGSSINI